MAKINLENGLNQFGKWAKSIWKMAKINLKNGLNQFENDQNQFGK